ncbi:hypothetical protein [Streptomyces lydicus]|uniref:hypothetical protein n=1 Tax=Streptomyces lydicus TaxID=47763 RepID=UPI0037A42258
MADGTRSGLWHHIVRAIDALNPCLVVIENVRGLLSSPASSLATWNPARGVWETPQPSLLGAHSVPYSAPWPTSGSMHAGACFAPPISEPPHHRARIFLAAWPSLRPTAAQDADEQPGDQRRQPAPVAGRSRPEPGGRGRSPVLTPVRHEGHAHGRGRKVPVGEAPLMEVLSPFSDAEAGPGSGGRTAPPSPDGKRSPAPRRSRPMTRAA